MFFFFFKLKTNELYYKYISISYKHIFRFLYTVKRFVVINCYLFISIQINKYFLYKNNLFFLTKTNQICNKNIKLYILCYLMLFRFLEDGKFKQNERLFPFGIGRRRWTKFSYSIIHKRLFVFICCLWKKIILIYKNLILA